MYITRQAPWHTGWDNMQNMLVKCRQTLCIIQTLAQSVPADECIQKSAVPCNKHSGPGRREDSARRTTPCHARTPGMRSTLRSHCALHHSAFLSPG